MSEVPMYLSKMGSPSTHLRYPFVLELPTLNVFYDNHWSTLAKLIGAGLLGGQSCSESTLDLKDLKELGPACACNCAEILPSLGSCSPRHPPPRARRWLGRDEERPTGRLRRRGGRCGGRERGRGRGRGRRAAGGGWRCGAGCCWRGGMKRIWGGRAGAASLQSLRCLEFRFDCSVGGSQFELGCHKSDGQAQNAHHRPRVDFFATQGTPSSRKIGHRS